MAGTRNGTKTRKHDSVGDRTLKGKRHRDTRGWEHEQATDSMGHRGHLPPVLGHADLLAREALFDATSIPAATRSDAVTAAWFGFILSFVHVGYVMACFMVEMPEPLKEVPVIGKFGKMLGWMLMVLLVVWYTRPRLFDGWEAGNLDAHGYLFVGVILLGFGTAAALTCLLYDGDKRSRLYALHRFVDVYPAITKPEGHVRFNSKLWTTTLVLIIYFAMTNVMLQALRHRARSLRWVPCHHGRGFWDPDASRHRPHRHRFDHHATLLRSEDHQSRSPGFRGQGDVSGGEAPRPHHDPNRSDSPDVRLSGGQPVLIEQFGLGWANMVIVGQLFAGSYLVFLLDELVSKWGIGSGMSLFIGGRGTEHLRWDLVSARRLSRIPFDPLANPLQDPADDHLPVP